jgi:hypothetical protein
MLVSPNLVSKFATRVIKVEPPSHYLLSRCPLIVSSQQLIVTSPLNILLLHPLVVVSSSQLVVGVLILDLLLPPQTLNFVELSRPQNGAAFPSPRHFSNQPGKWETTVH